MTRYLALISFTDAGIRGINDSVKRAHAFRSLVEEFGGHVSATYWAVGEYDGAVVFETPDDASGAAVLLNLAKQGFVRTHSLRVFDEAEFQSVLDRK